MITMEIQAIFDKAINHYKNSSYEACIISCGKAVEFTMRDLYTWLKHQYKEDNNEKEKVLLSKHFEYLYGNQKEFSIDHITLGSLITRYKKARIWKRISKTREVQFYHIYSVNWNSFRNLRNKAVHHKATMSKTEAEEMLSYAKIILLETGYLCEYKPNELILDATDLAEIKFRAFCEGVWSDEVITKKEAREIEKYRDKLNISALKAKQIAKEVIPKNVGLLIDVLQGILMDDKIFEYEKNFYFNKADEFGVDMEVALQLYNEHKPDEVSIEVNPTPLNMSIPYYMSYFKTHSYYTVH